MTDEDPLIGNPDSWRGDMIVSAALDDPIPVLYHSPPSYFSQLVRLTLEEQGIAYRSRAMDIHSQFEQLDSWYLQLNPAAVVPSFLYHGQAYRESKDISLFIAEHMSGSSSSLLPSEHREKVLKLFLMHFNECKVEELSFGTMLSSSMMMSMLMPRRMQASLTKIELVRQKHPELSDALDAKIEVLNNRLKFTEDPLSVKERALEQIQPVLDILEIELGKHTDGYLCGPEYTLADVVYTCLLARLSMIGLIDQELRDRKNLAGWWERMKARESFQTADIHAMKIGISFMAKKLCTIL